MGVIRMSLDDSQFTPSKPKEVTSFTNHSPYTQAAVSSARTGTYSVSMGTKKRRQKFPVSKIGVAVLVLALAVGSFFAIPKLFKKTATVLGNTTSLIPVINPELAKDADGKTNVLIVGIDTREKGTVELNTDTIILGSYDPVTNRLAMISFPRDLAVSYPGRTDLVRINSIYAIGENTKKGTGLQKLQEVVENISGKKIQYYAMVDLKGFIDAIDIVGGVDVYLDNDLSGLYPTDNYTYERVKFKRGWNTFNGQQALEYSRIRKEVIPASEGSDFGRARRQQKIIAAVIDKVSKSETLLNPAKLLELTSVASKNIKTSKITTEDLQAGVKLLKDKGKPTTFTYVLDLYAGGSLAKLIDLISYNPYLIGPKAGANNWSNIQRFITLYMREPSLATITKGITIYTGGESTATNAANSVKKQYYFAPITVSTKNPFGESMRGNVYAVGGKSYELTAKYIAKELNLQYQEQLPESFGDVDTKDVGVIAVY